MIDEQRTRINDSMTEMIEEVDKSHIRILQGKMFKCAAACCDDRTASMNGVQKCIATCARPLENAQNYLKNELSHFQDRLQRCIMTCNDNVRDKIGPNATDSEVTRYTNEFERCAKKCVDAHIALIPEMQKKIKEVIKKESH